MSGLDKFRRQEIGGKEIWIYGSTGHPEARVEGPGKYGLGDYKATFIAPSTCEIAPTMPALVFVAGAMMLSQKLWPESRDHDLDLYGYLEAGDAIKTIEEVVLNAHQCDVNWELHRTRHDRRR